MFLSLKTARRHPPAAPAPSRSKAGLAAAGHRRRLPRVDLHPARRTLSTSAGSWRWRSLAAVCLLAALLATRAGREGWAFIGTAATHRVSRWRRCSSSLFPNVMPSSLDPAWSLTTTNASSTDNTLTIMTWVAAIFTPLVVVPTRAWSILRVPQAARRAAHPRRLARPAAADRPSPWRRTGADADA